MPEPADADENPTGNKQKHPDKKDRKNSAGMRHAARRDAASSGSNRPEAAEEARRPQNHPQIVKPLARIGNIVGHLHSSRFIVYRRKRRSAAGFASSCVQ